MNSTSPKEKIDFFIRLLKYAPNDFIDKAILRLQEYEKLGNTNF
jgi:hypothetical protein